MAEMAEHCAGKFGDLDRKFLHRIKNIQKK